MAHSAVPHRPAVIDTSRSPHTRLQGLPVSAVTLGKGFWRPRLEANRTTGLPALHHQLEERGVIDNFRRIYGAREVPRRGLLFSDSDLYKWMEAAAFALQERDDPTVRRQLEETIAAVLPAQRADGYLNTYYVDQLYDQRYTRLDTDHETYCAGHLFQAAIAYRRAVGDNALFDAAVRFADHLAQVIPTMPGISLGHPEIEMALVEMYRETGSRRYLEAARFVLDDNHFADLPKLEGHVVRACYFCCGGADCYAESGDAVYLASLERQWRNLNQAKIYITGGAGGRYEGESLGRDYELPNARAYSETCAAISVAMWGWRMLQITGEAQYADVMERSLYNGFLAGVSLDGARFFYMNPLSYDGSGEGDPWSPRDRQGPYERQAWFSCTCCPPNVLRTFASLPGYMYSASDEGLWVHLYDQSVVETQLADGTTLRLAQDTRYPWDGRVALTVNPERPAEFALFVRIPGWAQCAAANVNGRAVGPAEPGTYLVIHRAWQPGDHVDLSLPMPPVPLVSDYRLAENRGSVALQRGPIVYCLEAVDNPGVDVLDVLLDPAAPVAATHRPDLLGGVTVLAAAGASPAAGPRPLYRRWHAEPPALRPVPLTAIPYYAWNNRGPGAMTVWMGSMR